MNKFTGYGIRHIGTDRYIDFEHKLKDVSDAMIFDFKPNAEEYLDYMNDKQDYKVECIEFTLRVVEE